MAKYTYKISAEHNTYPGLSVCERLKDGQSVGWRVTANDGYVFYDKNSTMTEMDPETNVEHSVIHYFRTCYLPLNFKWDSFSLVAVPSADVDKKYIF